MHHDEYCLVLTSVCGCTDVNIILFNRLNSHHFNEVMYRLLTEDAVDAVVLARVVLPAATSYNPADGADGRRVRLVHHAILRGREIDIWVNYTVSSIIK